ncbi:hypothetical protein HHK36_004756 [Tetracentron sinense]|uniref:Reverse transcriptase domain-containing protein n=1 Tax=Tetracentron sinense TaxID=13715 RepID=A0A835DLN6_TETSI|nr:hypothetical protein HHK36_004756 [Tetracentron sinense]
MIEGAHKKWCQRLSTELWAYRTLARTATGVTPFSLVYGTEVVVPLEVKISSTRIEVFDEEMANLQATRLAQLEVIDERREAIAMKTKAYQMRAVKAYDKIVQHRVLKEGDLVLRTTIYVRNGILFIPRTCDIIDLFLGLCQGQEHVKLALLLYVANSCKGISGSLL